MTISILSRSASRLRLAIRADARLGDLAERLAEVHGDRTLVIEENERRRVRTLTYREAADLVDGWARRIAARIEPGSPVVIATGNGIDQFLLCLAVSRAGGLPAPVNPQMSEAEVDHVIADAGATLVIRSPRDLSGPEADLPAEPSSGTEEVAALFYTSGTTGRPKGAALTHRGLIESAQRAAAMSLPLSLRRDLLVVALPVAHIMGFVTIATAACSGVPMYLLTRFGAGRVLEIIEERRASAFMGVPAMYRMLLEAGAESRDLRSVRVWMTGADVMPDELARRFKRLGATMKLPLKGPVGEAAFFEGYGMVEVAGGVAVKVSPPMLPVGLGESLGMPLPGWRMRVVDESGEPIAPGGVGELEVKGPGVLRGYWGDEDASSAVLTPDGWLRTGDLARSGPLGSVVFAGRSKHVIKSGGYTVYPVEVEADLEEHPAVVEAAVVGVPDDRLGEVPVAAVRLAADAGVDEQALVLWARDRMAHYKAPRRVIFVEDLPRTGTRKVQRAEVARLFEGRAG